MVTYSHSRLSTFEQCPLKFRFKYIDKLEPEIKQTIEGFLGNKVHESLEWFYQQIAQQKVIPKIDQLIQHYIQNWNKDFNKEIKIIKQEFDSDYYFNNGIKFLINYYQSNHPFEDNTIAIEKKIIVELDNKYELQGYIDRLVHHKDTNTFEIHDYKTSSFLKSQEELDKDRQLALYSLGIRNSFENVKDVNLIWHFLAFNKKLTSKRTFEQLEQLKKEIIQLINKIESEQEFNPNPSLLCKWCEFRSYCPLFNGHKKITQTKLLNPISNNLWSLYEDEKELTPLVFSNGKSQADVVNEVIDSINQGNKIIFIRGMCGTGKSAIALNLAKHFGKTSIVVPIKSLQEQYTKDYSSKKYVLKDNKKLKISPIVGRNNFKCKYLEENQNFYKQQENYQREKDTKLSDIFSGVKITKEKDLSCDNPYLPCKIELKEKNMQRIKDYIRKNPHVKISDFSSINDIKRMTIAPVCEYWSPIMPEEIEIRKFKDTNKIKYQGLNDKHFIIYQRKKGCRYYDQYEAYKDADVLIFNSLKYKLETLMDRKPLTEIEIIDECDDFLDSFANQEKINLNRLLFSLTKVFSNNENSNKFIDSLTDIVNAIKTKYFKQSAEPRYRFDMGAESLDLEILDIKNTLIENLIKLTLSNLNLIESIEMEESNYLYHLDEVARSFADFLDETYFSVEKSDKDLFLHLVTPNLAKRLNELVKKNKILVMMSGTIHSERVLKNIFGLGSFKVIDAETEKQGELIKIKKGYETDCKYENFKSGKISREDYLKSLSNLVDSAKPPTLIHLTSFTDLPSEREKEKYSINNLPSSQELINEQKNDPLGKRPLEFREGNRKILFTTKCNRGIDFPGETCNSIIITRFPYPNISSIFWRLLRKTKPQHFREFYMDKANRDLLQKVYRGLRNKNDKVNLLSPDKRVLDFNFD